MNKLGFNISVGEAEDAEFRFWPVFEDGTEPDLVIIVGRYYLLIEAKYFSKFGKKTETTAEQLIREIKGGQLEAKNYNKEFKLIAITSDYYYKKYKFRAILPYHEKCFKWTNWQFVSSFVDKTLNRNISIMKSERSFALDLYYLLDKKHLRSFQSITYNGPLLKEYTSIFFDARTAKLRGDFIGFIDSLFLAKRLKPVEKTVFFSSTKRIFKSLSKLEKLKKVKNPIFFKEDESNE